MQAFQNIAFAAMCRRVGQEDALLFAGQSLLAAPDGELLYKAGQNEELLIVDVPLETSALERAARPWLLLFPNLKFGNNKFDLSHFARRRERRQPQNMAAITSDLSVRK